MGINVRRLSETADNLNGTLEAWKSHTSGKIVSFKFGHVYIRKYFQIKNHGRK